MQLVFLRFEKIEETAHAAPIAFAVDDRVPLLPAQINKGDVHWNLFRSSEAAQLGLGPFVLRLGPWLDRAFAQRQPRIRNHEIQIKSDRVAESLTRRTCAKRIVETE